MTPRDDKYCKAEGAFVCRWAEPDCAWAGADYRHLGHAFGGRTCVGVVQGRNSMDIWDLGWGLGTS